MSDVSDKISNVQFKTVRLREGYDMTEVDDFLDQLVGEARAARSLAPLCDQVRLTTVRGRPGYDMDEVDRFLEEIGGRSASSPPVGSRIPDPAGPQVIQEQKGLFARLFGRG